MIFGIGGVMGIRNFEALLATREAAGLGVCVGLDSDFSRIPQVVLGSCSTKCEAIVAFNRAIVEATRDLALAYKPNRAFYEAVGIEGLRALQETFDVIHEMAPEVPVIFDAKYGDIGSSNAGYAAFTFDHLGADAVTLNPYLGGPETLKPFLRPDKGSIILCRTSNEEAGIFQDRMVQMNIGQLPLYQLVAREVSQWRHDYPGCGLVVGATYPQELAEVRGIVDNDILILVPAIGAQGGDLEATVRAGKRRMIINSSRGIIFASDGPDFAEAAHTATKELHDKIQAALAAIA